MRCIPLYHRYEQLRHLAGNPKLENRKKAFHKFICEVHKEISQEFNAGQIAFSLKKKTHGVTVTAFPMRQD